MTPVRVAATTMIALAAILSLPPGPVAAQPQAAPLWIATSDGGSGDFPSASALNPYRTVAYTVGGDLLRVDDYRVPDSVGIDYPGDIAVDPRNGQVYVTGRTWVLGGDSDFTTVAYPPAG